MTKIVFVIACGTLVAACDIPRKSPLAPTPVVLSVPQPPPYVPFFYVPFTQLAVGQTIQRRVDDGSNPECPGIPGFGCHYFRITPDRDGMLDVELTWVRETQPSQVLDLSHESTSGELWSDFYPPSTGRFESHVRAGETSQITVWYTFPGVEFTLQASLRPN